MIRILEKNVADKIAAGEVVDRPLSVVKELVENAIDSGASSIVCEIRKGGKSYIRVTDNGCGIPAGEAETAFLRHATSKIRQAEDLDHIGTLGFRGEALASISAVSKVEMITRTNEDKTGVRLSVEGGETTGRESIGCEVGTTVIVEDLFYNTPARLKFMKSDGAESALIIDFISQMALAYPHIKVQMKNNNNILFSTRGDGDRWKAIMTVGGANINDKLLTVDNTEGDRSLLGYVSGPGETRASRKNQVFFVNGRAVNSKLLEKAVDAAYRERLFQGRHPIAYLFLEVAPEKLDVNIHPNKREVRFHDEGAISDFVKTGLSNALRVKEALPQFTSMETKPPKTRTKTKSVTPVVKPMDESQIDVKQILSTFREENNKIADSVEEFKPTVPEMVPEKPFDFEDLTYLGVLFDTYIMLSDRDTFYLVDQHAAHERIFYERIMDAYEAEDTPAQEIMVPITFDARFVKDDWKEILKRFGFSLRDFGPDTYAAHGIPMFFDLSGAEKFLSDFVDTVDDDTNFQSQDVIDRIARKACKQAVKAGDVLSSQELKHLIDDLSRCQNPFSCPHGRPTFIRMSKQEIERKFKRT